MVKPYDKSFIDQACSVKMAGYWPRSFFAFLWTETKNAKKELGQYPAILTSRLVNNAYFHKSDRHDQDTYYYGLIGQHRLNFYMYYFISMYGRFNFLKNIGQNKYVLN